MPFLLLLAWLLAAGPALTPEAPAESSPAAAPAAEPVREGSLTMPTVEATPSWQAELAGTPAGPARAIAGDAADTLILVPLLDALEARRASDGTLAWRREGLGGAGLEKDPPEGPLPTPAGLVPPPIAWAGAISGGTAQFLLLAPESGETLASAELEALPLGPPLAARAGGGGQGGPGAVTWYVPLPGRRIAEFDRGARRIATIVTPGEISPPLRRVAGDAVAVVGSDRRAARVGAAPRRDAPAGIDPATLAEENGVVAAARDRSIAAWRVRRTRRGALDCDRDWEQKLGAKVSAPPLFADSLLLVPSWDTHLYAFEVRSGHLVWRARTGHRLTATPRRWRIYAIVQPETAPAVLVFDLVAGRPAGRIGADPGEQFLAAPALVGDLLVAPTSRPPSKAAVLRAWTLRAVAARP